MSARHSLEWFAAQIAEADARGNNWLAEANEANERGSKAKAERCYGKGQFWLDRSNQLRDKAGYLFAGHPAIAKATGSAA